MNNGLPNSAATVSDYVDPHARRLVDAINTSPLTARTFGCCSGHYHKPGLPYVAFHCLGWDFIHFLLTAVTGLNHATKSQSSISLRDYRDEREIAGSLKLTIYPWLLRGFDCTPLIVEQVKPPRRLVRLWWAELDELAAMIEERRARPSREFAELLDEQWRASHDGRRRPTPAWARLP